MAHVDDHDLGRAGDRGPVEGGGCLASLVVAGDEGHGLVDVAVRHRDACVGQATDSGGDAGDDADGDAVLDEGLRLLSSAAEDEGVAAFEPQHAFARAGQVDEAERDVALFRRGFAAAFARVEGFGLGRPGEKVFFDQRIVDDDIGLLQRIQAVEREQAGVARACAAEPDPAGKKFGPVGLGECHRHGVQDGPFRRRQEGGMRRGVACWRHPL